MGAFIFLLLIAAAAVGLMFLLLPPRLSRLIVKVVGQFFLAVLIIVIFRALMQEIHSGPQWVFLFLVLCSLAWLFVWGLTRLFAQAPPADRAPRLRPKELLREVLAKPAPAGQPNGRQVAILPLVLATSLMIFMLLLLSESAFKPGHPFTTMFFFVVFCVTVVVVIWGILRLIGWSFSSTTLSVCPPISQLKDFLRERLRTDDRARVAAHLDYCTSCQHRVEGLTAGQDAWTGLARRLSPSAPPPVPALKRVMENLKGNQEPDATRDEPVFAGDLPLGFLSPSEKPDQLGRLERYEVLSEIGRGGMGIVLKAFDPSLHRVVAIKVLAPQLATSGVARKRFMREAKAAAAVTHEHIVTIHAVEEANGLPYLVMQYVAGQSLQDRIDRDGPISDLPEVLRIGIQTASALAAAHGHGIVHRDIKPGNILLEEGVQRVKITDFGLARAMDDASLTQSGFVAGSPLYMAPEQARGEGLDHRADLFSLGSVLYTVCTGRPPFRAANTLAVLRRVCDDVPRPIRETNPEIPDWLAGVIEKLMAKEPGERFQSASEVVEVLCQHLAEFQHAAWMPAPAPAPAPASANPPAGLPTSLTICPSCGASLHVSERMVGSLVHCAECGKPFRVEDGSDVMQIARPVPMPFAKQRRSKGRMPLWYALLIVVGIVGFVVPMVYLVRESERMPPMAPPDMAPALVGPSSTKPLRPAEPFWKDPLRCFPAEATLFGAVDLKAFGTLNLGDTWTETALRFVLPSRTKLKLTPETLGRIQLDGVSAAYYEDPKGSKSSVIVQLQGLALDGRKRIVDYLRDSIPERVKGDEERQKWLPSRPMSLSSPGLPFAVGLLDDRRAFLARAVHREAKDAPGDRDVLERLQWFDRSGRAGEWSDLVTGYQPPWLQKALAEIPSDARGLCVGEIPAAWRKLLTESLSLRACPRSFVLDLKRRGDGVVVSLRLNTEKPGTERILSEDVEKCRRQALDMLQARYPVLRQEPKAIGLIGNTLRSRVRWRVGIATGNAGGGNVRINLEIPRDSWRALGQIVKRLAQSMEKDE
jgi:serine/threonine protein kinase